MTNTGKKLTALLVALMMLLSIVPALAEAPAGETPFDRILKSGKNLKSEVTIQLNPQAGALISSMSGSQPDEESMKVFQAISDAISKLKATFIASASGVSGVVGTDKGDLIDMQMSYNQDGSDLKMTSSMLPGVYMTVDPEMMAKFASQANIQASLQAIDQEKVMEKAQAYLDVVTNEVGKIQQASGSEEGSFDTPYGTFKKCTKVTITSQMVAGLMTKLGEVYAKDEDLQAKVKEMVLASEAMNSGMQHPQGGETAEPKEYKDPILDMLESSKSAFDSEDQPLFDLVVYENENSVYVDLANLPDNPQPFNVQVHVVTEETTANVNVKYMLAGFNYTAEGETPEPTDWVALEQNILSGADSSAMLVEVKVNAVSETETKNKTAMTITLASAGMSASISINSAVNIETMESSSELALSMMMPDPLLKITMNSAPTDEQPVAPVVEGMKEVVLKEEMSEEDQKLLMEASANMAPALLEKLQTALPDEAPSILQLIQNSMGGSQESEMPEPSVESESK
ncbi:MAG: hypothetical protein QM308_07960 [Bacillota bacterium]|nr:hypothetical protein [Bacillota bacterium]